MNLSETIFFYQIWRNIEDVLSGNVRHKVRYVKHTVKVNFLSSHHSKFIVIIEGEREREKDRETDSQTERERVCDSGRDKENER